MATAVAIVVLAAVAGLLVGGWSTDDDAPAQQAAAQPPIAAAYEAMLASELAMIADARAADLKRLRSARTPAMQARASRALARTYGAVAEQLAEAQAPADLRSENERLARALRSAGVAYDRLGLAATREQRSSYERARKAVRRAESMLRRALAASLSVAAQVQS